MVSMATHLTLFFLFQGGARALDPGQVRAAAVRGLAATPGPPAGAATAQGSGRRGRARRGVAPRPRQPATGQRDVRRW